MRTMKHRTTDQSSALKLRWNLFFCLLLLPVAGAVGCSMCCGPYDYDYPMFQSSYQRVDPVYGRVGSIFSDPNVAPDGARPLTNADIDEEGDDASDYEELDDPEFRQDDPDVDPFEGVDPEDLEGMDTSTGTQTRHWDNEGWN